MAFTTLVFLSFVALVFSIKIPDELQEYLNDLHNICIEKSGITKADYEAYDIKNNPHDSKLQCYMKCLMLEANWMSADGIIQYKYILENAHPEIKNILEPAINKCRNIQDDANLCQKASNFNFCMFQAEPEEWYLV